MRSWYTDARTTVHDMRVDVYARRPYSGGMADRRGRHYPTLKVAEAAQPRGAAAREARDRFNALHWWRINNGICTVDGCFDSPSWQPDGFGGYTGPKTCPKHT